ncbi:MAG TPA: hypothetical protein VH186_33560 [Chloroflexia bacterium]|nr:hypothetical protein [Chloroflexia bacterium]
MRPLKLRLPEFAIYDFDQVFTTSSYYAQWQQKPQETRQRATEYWLQKALDDQANASHSIVCGGAVLGEILACPCAPLLEGIKVCLLDCYDVLRMDRITRWRFGMEVASMETLIWAGWLRMHAVDPQWWQDVIKMNSAPEMEWSRWDTWQRGDPRWEMWPLDITLLNLDETAEQLVKWINSSLPESSK